jgi:hypothetical protein
MVSGLSLSFRDDDSQSSGSGNLCVARSAMVSAGVDRSRRTAGLGLPKAAARKGLSCGRSRGTDSSCGGEPRGAARPSAAGLPDDWPSSR